MKFQLISLWDEYYFKYFFQKIDIFSNEDLDSIHLSESVCRTFKVINNFSYLIMIHKLELGLGKPRYHMEGGSGGCPLDSS